MMQAAACLSRSARPAPPYRTADPREPDSTNGLGAVWALLEEIKVREPSRHEIVQAVATASDDALSQAACGRVADAVLALWRR
jgi:hypothetical protein